MWAKLGCKDSCVNETSQQGIKYRLEEFRTPKKGWVVRYWDFISAGSPICEYTGILMRTKDIDNTVETTFAGSHGTGKTQTILGLLSAILHATPTSSQSKGETLDIIPQLEMSLDNKYSHWKLASPWLYDCNPRDQIMPIDGDDGFYPTPGNDMKPEVVNSNRKYRAPVLVCAPSNSVFDEIEAIKHRYS